MDVLAEQVAILKHAMEYIDETNLIARRRLRQWRMPQMDAMLEEFDRFIDEGIADFENRKYVDGRVKLLAAKIAIRKLTGTNDEYVNDELSTILAASREQVEFACRMVDDVLRTVEYGPPAERMMAESERKQRHEARIAQRNRDPALIHVSRDAVIAFVAVLLLVGFVAGIILGMLQ